MKFVAKVVTKKMDYPYSLGRLLENLSKQSIKTMDARYQYQMGCGISSLIAKKLIVDWGRDWALKMIYYNPT